MKKFSCCKKSRAKNENCIERGEELGNLGIFMRSGDIGIDSHKNPSVCDEMQLIVTRTRLNELQHCFMNYNFFMKLKLVTLRFFEF